MAKREGFWSLDCDVELDQDDLDYIAEALKAGFTSGEVCLGDDDKEGDWNEQADDPTEV